MKRISAGHFFRTAIAIILGLSLIEVASCRGRSQKDGARPRLVVVISIDQMRYDYLERFHGLFTGGFKTLTERGALFTNARYRYSSTETGPGHSVILSGRHPSHSGIVANEWYDRYRKQTVYVVDDPVQSSVGGVGQTQSPANFNGFTVGDALKFASPLSKVVGVSVKDRAAVLMAGPRADAAYWSSVSSYGRFVTSTYYMKSLPDWLERWNARDVVAGFRGKKWERLPLPASEYEKYAGPDDVQGESYGNDDRTFPHNIGEVVNQDFVQAFQRTPFADEITLDVALDAQKGHELGRDEATDILAIGFSATDYIGHYYGPDSQEMMDNLLRLDRTLDRLLREIDGRIGLENTLIVLTADHGVMPLVENLKAKGLPAKRVSPRDLKKAVEEALSRSFPNTSLLAPGWENFSGGVYLDETAMARAGLDRRAVEDVVKSALMSTGVIESAYTGEEVLSFRRGGNPAQDAIANAYFEPRSADVVFQPMQYVFISEKRGGTGHGTVHDYDRHVPILFMGKGIRPGTYAENCGPEDIAPTIASILGISYPGEWDSRILSEMLSGGPARQ